MNLFPVCLLPSTVTRSAALRLASGLVLAALILSGCATVGQGAGAESASTLVEPDAETTQAQQQDADLPHMELSSELLTQLLTTQFSLTVADWQLGADNAMLAAQASQDYRVARIAALLAMRSDDYALAVDAASLWFELVPADQNAEITLIAALLGTGAVEQAYTRLQNRQRDSDIDEHIITTAALLVRQRNAESAIGVMQRYLLEFPDSAQTALSAARVAQNFARTDLQDQWLEQALALRPGWDQAAQMKIGLLREQGKIDERAAFIEEFISAHPESIAMRINHAAELARQEQYPQALSLMQQLLEDDPENVRALAYTAALAEYLQEDELAVDLLNQILRLQPENDDARWSLARFSVRAQEYRQAERLYQQIGGDEYYFRAQLQVANMRYQISGLQGAINVLRTLQPRTEQEYVDRASTRHYLLMQERHYEEAFGAVNETLSYLPENTELRYARALVAAEINEIETAEEDLRFILQRQPDHADALNALGYTLADRTDRLEEARKLIEQALELAPQAAHILDSMGWVLYRLQDFEQAVVYLRRAYETAPQAEIAAHLGEVLWEQGEAEEARSVWQEGFALDADNPVLLQTMERYGVTVEPLKSEDLSFNGVVD